MSEQFKEWVESDNVVKIGENLYRTQCTLYSKAFTFEELKQYWKNEYEEV